MTQMQVETEITPPDLWQREDGTWRARLLGVPVGGSGPNANSATEDLVHHLRRWASDWSTGRHAVASSLALGDELAEFVAGRDDETLTDWILSSAV